MFKKENSLQKLFLILLSAALTLMVISCADEQESDGPAVQLDFPADHSFHDGIEWVYFSGILKTEEGTEFGFMFTMFQMKMGSSKFYPVVLAFSDPETSSFYSVENMSMMAIPGTAETVDGFPVITSGDSRYELVQSGEVLISSVMDELAMDLTLEPTLDVLPHGEDGIITMGDGIDSGYYSFTNMIPSGTFSIDGQSYTVSGGRMWMDHQWGNYTHAGMNWDWFSIRFDDGGSLMVFQFRDSNNNLVPGNWTYRDGNGVVTYGTYFTVTANRTYDFEGGGATYPVDWHITIPSLDAAFDVNPLFDEQAINASLWEGLCSVDGTIGDVEMTGNTFVEMTGY